jgi:prophage DNA circulation protein
MSGSINATTLAATASLVAGLQAVTEAVRTACADPAQAITLLAQLANYAPTSLTGSDAIGAAMTAVEKNVAAVCRRAALTSLARATAVYLPSSYQDAVALRNKVAGLIETEMLIAGGVPDYPMYVSLRALRVAVIEDLTARGGDLARVNTVTTSVPMPALTLAYRLYGDASRYDDLVARTNPVSPLFMPTSFEALSS